MLWQVFILAKKKSLPQHCKWGGVHSSIVKRCIFGGAREKGVNTSVKVAKISDTVHIVINRCVRQSQRLITITQGLQSDFRRNWRLQRLQNGYKSILRRNRRLQRLHDGYKRVAHRFHEFIDGSNSCQPVTQRLQIDFTKELTATKRLQIDFAKKKSRRLQLLQQQIKGEGGLPF